MITNEIEGAFTIIPQRKREHSIQTLQTRFTPFSPSLQQNLCIGLRSELMTFGDQLLTQLAIVVDLAVENDDESIVMREHRLVTGAARVDDRKPAMTEGNALTRVIQRRRRPHTFIVAPAMLNSFQHRANTRFRTLLD